MIRDYDVAVVTKLGGLPTAAGSAYELTPAALTSPVPLVFGQADEWWLSFALPAVNITRLGIYPDPNRLQANFRPAELVGSVWQQQAVPSVPINLVYEIELAAGTQGEMLALVEHVLLALPPLGFGTSLSVYGRMIGYRANGMVDRTDYLTKQGRMYRYAFTYVVEAWVGSTDTVDVPAIDALLIQVERHPPQTPFVPTPPEPGDPDAITVITLSPP